MTATPEMGEEGRAHPASQDRAFAASPSSPSSGSGPSGLQSHCAWTPGPWKLEQWQSGALYVGYGRVGRDGIDGIIAAWPDAGDYTETVQAQMQANARLIAAAPDYDDFARDALPQLEVLHSTLPKGEARSAVWRVILKGRAAVAKARGEQC